MIFFEFSLWWILLIKNQRSKNFPGFLIQWKHNILVSRKELDKRAVTVLKNWIFTDVFSEKSLQLFLWILPLMSNQMSKNSLCEHPKTQWITANNIHSSFPFAFHLLHHQTVCTFCMFWIFTFFEHLLFCLPGGYHSDIIETVKAYFPENKVFSLNIIHTANGSR